MFDITVVPQERLDPLRNDPSEDPQGTAEEAIRKEKQVQVIRAEKRMKIFQNILNSTSPEFTLIQPLLTSLAAVVVAIFTIGVYAMVPVHNVYESPEKWFEYPLQSLFSFWPIYAAHILFDSIYFLNTDIIRSFRTFGTLYIALAIVCWAMFSLSYTIWNHAFGLRYPVPLIGYINFFTMTVTCLFTIWFQFPMEWRKNHAFRKRLKWNLLTILALNLCVAEYIGCTAALVLTPENFQWIIAVILPFVRQINLWITTSMAKNCYGGDPLAGEIYMNQCLSNIHASFLSYSVGTVATLSTSVVIIAAEFFINLIVALRLLWVRHKEDSLDNNLEIIKLLQELVISELTEVLTPLTYLGCIIMAYYGPNSEIIGNVRNSWFHFIAIEDLEYTLKMVATFFFVDLGSLAVSAGLIWKFGSINFFQAFAALQNEFWLAFGNNLVTSFLGVSTRLIITSYII